VRKDGEVLDMVLRRHGGDHTALKLRVKLNASGRSYNPVADDLIAAFTGRHSPSRPLTPIGAQRAFDFQ